MAHSHVAAEKWRRFPLVLGAVALSLILIQFLFPAIHVDAAVTTISSVKSGLWTDPTVWKGGRTPTKDTKVVISPNTLVVFSGVTTVAGITVAPSSALAFDPKKSGSLNSSANVVVNGVLSIRPSSAAVNHSLTFIGVDNNKFVGGGMDVMESDVGLWVMGSGRLDAQGTPKTAWTNAASGIGKGVTRVTTKGAVTGWNSGDELVITPTNSTANPSYYEEFDDVGVRAASGNAITTARPTQFAHPVVNNTWTAEAMNLTRNVKISGTATGASHIFIHSSVPQIIRYVELTYMGAPESRKGSKEKVIGRYALHFHHNMDGSKGSLVEGVVVHKALSHAFVPHASNGITFRDTISYDTVLTPYWWDNSKKTDPMPNQSDGILIDHAMAAYAKTKANVGMETALSGYFLQESKTDLSNEIRNSVAVGIVGHTESSGFKWNLEPTAWKFNNNITHNNKVLGVFVWQNTGFIHPITNLDVYNTRIGIRHGAYKNQYQYTNIRIYGSSENGINLFATSRQNRPLSFSNVTIDGAGNAGIFVCCHQLQGSAEATVIQNITIKNAKYGVLVNDGKDADWVSLKNVTNLATIPYYITGGPVETKLEVQSSTEHFYLVPKNATAPVRGAVSVPAWNAWKIPVR